MGFIQRQSEFVPSTVASRTGNVGFQNGQLNFNLSPQQQAQATMLQNQANSFYNQAGTMDPTMAAQMQGNFGAADQARQRAMMDPAAREQEVYERIRATQRPEEQRQMEQMNSNLFGSGRGGMFTSAYGGTPEQMAFGKAQAEARNSAMLGAMNQSQTEMMNQGSLANQFGQMGMSAYGQGLAGQQAMMGMGQLAQQGQYMPEQMLLQQFGAGNQMDTLRSQAQQSQAGMLAQLGLGGMTTDVNWSNTYAGLLGEIAKAAGAAGGGLGEYLGSLI